MKILYIAADRGAAQAAVRSLRSIAPNVRLTWAQTPAAALAWLEGNPDAQAVIVDGASQTPGCTEVLRQVRGIGVPTPVAVISPDHLQALLAVLRAGLDAVVSYDRSQSERLHAQLKEVQAWREQTQQRLAERQVQHDVALARSTRICTALQEHLFGLEGALRTSEERHAAKSAAVEQAGRLEAQLRAELAEAASSRTALERRLGDAEATHQAAQQRATAELAAAVERYALLDDQLGRETAARAALEARLAAAELSRQDADRHHAADVAALTTRLGEEETQHRASLTRSTRICTALQVRLLELEPALRAAEERHAADTSAIERLQSRERDLSAALAEAIAVRTAVELRLDEAESAHTRARQRAAVELAALSERHAALEHRFHREADARKALEQQLAAAEDARRHADQQYATELASLTARLADVRAQQDAAAERGTTLERELADAATALEQARTDWKAELAASAEQHAIEVATLTARLAAVQAQHDAAAERGTTLEHQLADAATALEQARTDWKAELAASAEQHAIEVATLTARLADVQAQHDAAALRSTTLEGQLAETAAALEQARTDRHAEVTAAAEREAALQARLGQALEARAEVDSQLSAVEAARRDADQQYATGLASLTARLASVQAQYEAATGHGALLEGRLDETTAAFDQARADWNAGLAAAAEQRTALEQRVREEQTSRRLLQHALADANENARIALDAGNREIARFQREGDALRRQLDAMRAHAAALRRETERTPVLRRQLEESRKENRRQFERAPYGLFECTREGEVTRANHSLARLVGYRSNDGLQGAAVVETVFECPADLRWLLERTVESGKPQSVETTFKTRDRRRLSVRLHAVTTDGPMVIAVEDLTSVAALEQRLREAQRLEAVGRVASEVAVTCGALLQDVTHGGRHWLARFETNALQRLEGERLLADVTRAAGYLRQFVAYGNKQVSSLGPVSMRGVLRDLEPVLKRVLGADIILVLPKTTDAFEVDLEVERVERILITVANYARERMPRGGRVQIQLATTVVERRIVARYPMVRPGPHVLITITEVQDTGLPASVSEAVRAEVRPAASEKPAMDLGPLVALIAGAGGHLWMSAEPAGNMTLQIHLPKRVQDDAADQDAAASWSNRGRQLARWFRH